MSDGSRGEAFIPSINRFSAVVISDECASDSLAHVLLDHAHHDGDADNLMVSGSIRNVGVDHLTEAHCRKASG